MRGLGPRTIALALKINTPKHECFEYKMAAPYIDMADAIQDAQQDGFIR